MTPHLFFAGDFERILTSARNRTVEVMVAKFLSISHKTIAENTVNSLFESLQMTKQAPQGDKKEYLSNVVTEARRSIRR